MEKEFEGKSNKKSSKETTAVISVRDRRIRVAAEKKEVAWFCGIFQ